jgi:DNA-binding XRE family transcriptional regulator
MRQVKKIPRILRVNEVNGLKASVVFSNGERRTINFEDVFDAFKIDRRSPAYKLRKPSEFKKLRLRNNTLSWENVEQYVLFNDSRMKVPFEIGADVLYKMSTPAEQNDVLSLGLLLREARERAGMTQEMLAQRSGTTRNYISRIENEHTSIGLSTLKRIVEEGLGQKLEIGIKPQ